MGHNESNFIYLKRTGLEKYYAELVKAEYIHTDFPEITKIIARKIIEGILKDIADKSNIDSNLAAKSLLKNIKDNSEDLLPKDIYNCIKAILDSGYEDSSRSKRKSKEPIVVLESTHNVLLWYLDMSEPEKIISLKELTFEAPSSIEYVQKEISKINEDILLKDNQINNLRNKIIELGIKSKSISELNNIIIAIKGERLNLENLHMELNQRIKIQKEQVEEVEKNHSVYIKKLDNIKKIYSDNEELLLKKESQLLSAEMQKKELKVLEEELYEKDESIKIRERNLEEELKIIRESYENLLRLTNQYQDILETIEFSYDEELQNVLEKNKNNVEIEINFENRRFNENVISYSKNISEAKRKIIIFKEILNENIKSEIKYETFYKGFLKLEGKEIKIIYTIITYVSNTIGLINKSKELLGKYNEDKFLELLNKNLEKFKMISNDEFKLILYYKLMKLSEGLKGRIYNKREFIQFLDSMVDRSYEILLHKKDFKSKSTKIDSIITYYLAKVIMGFKNKNSNTKIPEVLIDRICKKIIKLKENPRNINSEKIYFDKFNLDDMSENALIAAIRLQPIDFLEVMVDLGSSDSYKEISNIIFEVEMMISKRYSGKEEIVSPRFSNEYFIIILFLSSGNIYLNNKQQEELLPLLVMIIMSIDLISDKEIINIEKYNSMVDTWKTKQEKYNDIYAKKEDEEVKLEALIKENKQIEINSEKLASDYHILSEKYNNYKKEFKIIVMNSDKRILLPSFMTYDQLRSKKEIAESHINESKNKVGMFKSILSPEMWKEQASKIINESNMVEIEKVLFEEAKEKPYFKKEYQVFLDLEEKIKETDKLIENERELLKKNSDLINDTKDKINELQKQLSNIKELYTDMKEG